MEQLVLIYLISIVIWIFILLIVTIIGEHMLHPYGLNDEYDLYDIIDLITRLTFVSLFPIYRVYAMYKAIKCVQKMIKHAKENK